MDKPQHPYHISDVTWRRIEPHLSGQKGQWGGIAKDNRLFINAVLWILRTGAPWRKLGVQYTTVSSAGGTNGFGKSCSRY